MAERYDYLRRDGRCYAAGDHLLTILSCATIIEKDWIYLSHFRWVRTNFFKTFPEKQAYFTVAWYNNSYNLIDYHEL